MNHLVLDTSDAVIAKNGSKTQQLLHDIQNNLYNVIYVSKPPQVLNYHLYFEMKIKFYQLGITIMKNHTSAQKLSCNFISEVNIQKNILKWSQLLLENQLEKKSNSVATITSKQTSILKVFSIFIISSFKGGVLT